MNLVSGIERIPKVPGAPLENRPGNCHKKLPTTLLYRKEPVFQGKMAIRPRSSIG